MYSILMIMTMVISKCSNLQILGLFPHPGASHFRSVHPILVGLAEAGHDVIVVGHYPDPHPVSNYKDLIIEGEKSMLNSIDLAVRSQDIREQTRY